MILSYIPLNNNNKPTQGDIGETSNDPTQAKRNEFEELYASANEELYPGCDHVTRLDFMAKFTYFKVKGKLTDSIFNEMLEFFQNVFPTAKGYKLPPSYYAIKKTFKTIGLGCRDYRRAHRPYAQYESDGSMDHQMIFQLESSLSGVEWAEDDPDVIHVDNSSDLALSTSLNNLEIAVLHIDGQSIDVDAPPDIIDVVDEDDDIIDEEDPIPP
ncbi:hypothetical protein Tco_0627412 [Tanacetum coccineum]|uniref:Transposase n=1 Tax=Tanacetum coccineum TaxID=301880 RepID=A0ABQ4WMG3_9ASTR